MANKARILAFDIEASNLKADFGLLLTFGFKVIGRTRTQVLNVLDYRGRDHDIVAAEKRLLMDVTKVMLGADIWLTHYGSRGRYDMNFLQTRLLYHNLPPLPPLNASIDTWRTARNELALSSNRLAAIAAFLKTKEEKNRIEPEDWLRALGGDRKAMAGIVEHNRRDVEVLEEVYLRLRPLMMEHPHIGERDSCGKCGSPNIVYTRWRLTKTRRYREFQCKNCGGWQSSKVFEVLR